MLATLPASWTSLGRGFCLQRAPPGLASPLRSLNVIQFRRAAHVVDQPNNTDQPNNVHPFFAVLESQDENKTNETEKKKTRGRKRRNKQSQREKSLRKMDDAEKLRDHTRIPHPRPPLDDLGTPWSNDLFKAMRRGETLRASKILVRMAWYPESRGELVDMAPTTFAEVLDCVDPLRAHAELDVLDGARVTPSAMLLSDIPSLVNVNAVRWIYRDLLENMYPVVKLRLEEGQLVPASAFLVLFRMAGACAGAAYTGAIVELAREAARVGLTDAHILASADFYCDYVKTKFLTEPLYYQYDRSNVRLRPRYCRHFRLTRYQERKLDMIMLRLRLNQVPLNGEFKGAPGSATWQIHNKVGQAHLTTSVLSLHRLNHIAMTEELFCTTLVASTRSGTTHLLRKLFEQFHKIVIHVDYAEGVAIRGGFPETAKRIRVTEKTIYAVSRALGAIGEMDFALKLISYLSRLYSIPVPSGVWADWMSWADVHGSKPAVYEWQVVGHPTRLQAPRQIVPMVKMIRELGYRFNLGLDELVIVAKRLIERGKLDEAADALRHAFRAIITLMEKQEMAALRATATLTAGIYLNHTSPDMHLAKERDMAIVQMQEACQAWLEKAGQVGRAQRKEGPGGRKLHDPAARLTTVTVPDFVAEFRDLLPGRIMYDAPTGEVEIDISPRSHHVELREVTSPVARLDIVVPKIRTRRVPNREVNGPETETETGPLPEDTDGQMGPGPAAPPDLPAFGEGMGDWRQNVGDQLRGQGSAWAPESSTASPAQYEEYEGYGYDRVLVQQTKRRGLAVRPPDSRIARINRAVVFRVGDRLAVFGRHESMALQARRLVGLKDPEDLEEETDGLETSADESWPEPSVTEERV